MTDLLVLPSPARAVRTALLDQDEFLDFADPSPIVCSQLPKTKPDHIVQLTQINDQHITKRPAWFVATFFNLNVYGAGETNTEDLARLTDALLRQRVPGVHDDIVISAVDVDGLRDEPDEAFNGPDGKAKPRWVALVTVYSRPVPSVGS